MQTYYVHFHLKRMTLWRTIYLQSNIKEVLCLSFSISIPSLCFSSFSYFNLHFPSFSNRLRNSTNKITCFLSLLVKILILYEYLLQIHFGFSSFSHPINALEACGLLTPLHIVPAWYFLCQEAMLKTVPKMQDSLSYLLRSSSYFTL